MVSSPHEALLVVKEKQFSWTVDKSNWFEGIYNSDEVEWYWYMYVIYIQPDNKFLLTPLTFSLFKTQA